MNSSQFIKFANIPPPKFFRVRWVLLLPTLPVGHWRAYTESTTYSYKVFSMVVITQLTCYHYNLLLAIRAARAVVWSQVSTGTGYK